MIAILTSVYMQCLKAKGLRLNKSKCSFLNNTMSFFGQVFSREGTRPDPKRVTDLLNAPQPTNSHEVRSFLGMANYSSKYIRDFATLTVPLRELTRKNTGRKMQFAENLRMRQTRAQK